MKAWALFLVSATALADGGAGGAALERALKQHAACTADAQCRSLGLGARPCGGPAGWRAYSTAALKPAAEARLRRQAEQAAARQRQLQREEGRMGICQVLPDPGARCEAGRCVNGGSAAAH